MKNYTTKEELPGILEDLANKFTENSDKISIEIELVQYHNSAPILEVVVKDNKTWKRLTEQKYTIIEKIADSYDIVGDTVNTALAELEKPNTSNED